ncbi:HNH endonuclease [Mycobacterium phage DrLupo]|uniref:Uncharacterized protein n=1 Tax=Mycobacterium phage DrLupo TaxID=2499037 RepID=A0A3S9UQM0_9CAUD|nr:HNH endonuclease [Mycobacterium phage DrLupo]AZS12590.1 hypothetical protein SEA_DRLUPO_54 [Mycobacterium phage DrLupo]
MDPDATLAELRGAIAEGDFETAATHFEALDAWLSRGGFVPHDWQHRQSPAMIVVEDKEQISALTEAFVMSDMHKLRVWIDGDRVKFKVNEHSWSPPMGRIQEPY